MDLTNLPDFPDNNNYILFNYGNSNSFGYASADCDYVVYNNSSNGSFTFFKDGSEVSCTLYRFGGNYSSDAWDKVSLKNGRIVSFNSLGCTMLNSSLDVHYSDNDSIYFYGNEMINGVVGSSDTAYSSGTIYNSYFQFFAPVIALVVIVVVAFISFRKGFGFIRENIR